MPAFEFYIASEKTPTLSFRVVLVKDAERAREVAEAVLRESPAYTGVEVRQASKFLFAIGSLASLASPPAASSRASHGHA